MPRGGKRPGAGAPKGNLNAWKHGRHSKAHRAFIEILARDPKARDLLNQIAKGNAARQTRDTAEAKRLLNAYVQRLRAEITAYLQRTSENNRRENVPADTKSPSD